jgi:hypothetical protein
MPAKRVTAAVSIVAAIHSVRTPQCAACVCSHSRACCCAAVVLAVTLPGVHAGFCNGTFGHEYDPFGGVPFATKTGRPGRPMGMHCQPANDHTGKPNAEWGSVPNGDLFDPKVGWCNAPDASQMAFQCPCLPYEQADKRISCAWTDGDVTVCVNQCTGHGRCLLGFCLCHSGWCDVCCLLRSTLALLALRNQGGRTSHASAR